LIIHVLYSPDSVSLHDTGEAVRGLGMPRGFLRFVDSGTKLRHWIFKILKTSKNEMGLFNVMKKLKKDIIVKEYKTVQLIPHLLSTPP
jgi:hypothetical protein